ncbi:hypothetical protein JRO89_XS01G0157400 [Xanthoceras sorbifolium]|uniref:Apple domain-containing protein n=1 Tax=Xanthoceras sorbifolium TaxID=99658 RepID=A0ABQ8IK31_9ROSI|nr:hypothetical protein JRO89_XS01G0157400 [Xanthoceras sorbifolium]
MDGNLVLKSWKSNDNPAEGEFKFQLEDNQYTIKRKMSITYWKSGVSGDFMSDDILPIVSSLLSNSDRSDNSGSCQRTTPLCSNGVPNILNFRRLKVNKVRKPDKNFEVSSENDCKDEYLNDCYCQGYSNETSQFRGVTGNTACWIWSDDLNNIQFEVTNGGREIHLRVQPNISAEANQTKPDGGPHSINNQFNQWPLAFAVIVASALALAFTAWRLWQEDKVLDMMDRKLSAGSKTKTNEILKCINVGLLCVQEDPDDRPTMSDVITMLSSVSATLSTPKRPAFIVSRGFNYMASSSSSKAETNNEITITLEGR